MTAINFSNGSPQELFDYMVASQCDAISVFTPYVCSSAPLDQVTVQRVRNAFDRAIQKISSYYADKSLRYWPVEVRAMKGNTLVAEGRFMVQFRG